MMPNMTELARLAAEYCNTIESANEGDSEWLKRLTRLLPRLHAAVTALDDPANGSASAHHPDLDTRFEKFAQLRRLLGHRDPYWMEFDVAPDEQSMSGSLADDLTDIYYELKHGLNLVEKRPQQACHDWCSSYRSHWGQHLVDAEHHLYELTTRDQL